MKLSALRWQQKATILLLLTCCMLPTLLTMAYTDAGFWWQLSVFFTGLLPLGAAVAVLPLFWGLLLYGLLLTVFLPLELATILGVQTTFNYGFLTVIMNTNPRESLDSIMPYWLPLLLFISAVVTYFFLLFRFVPKCLRIRIPWIPCVVLGFFGLMVAAMWGTVNLTGNTYHRDDAIHSWGEVVTRQIGESFPLKYLVLYRDYKRYADAGKEALRARQAFFDTLTCQATSRDTIIGCLVIGETSRACNWQLAGYHRETNPRLAKRKNLVFFPYAATTANATPRSVERILFSTHEDLAVDWTCTPMLQELVAKAIGVEATAVATTQNDKRYSEDYGEILFSNLGRHYLLDSMFGPIPPDECLLPYAKQEIVNHAHKNLLLTLWGYGGHWFYPDRYPEKHAVFKPCNAQYWGHSVDPRDKRIQALRNAYDNTIYHTDYVLDSVISILEHCGKSSFLVYVADHGENIYDTEDMLFLHASYLGTHQENHVPLLFWFSDGYIKKHRKEVDYIKEHQRIPVMSIDVYHTILQLFELQTPWFDSTQSLASGAYCEHKNQQMYNGAHQIQPAPPFPQEERMRIDSILAASR